MNEVALLSACDATAYYLSGHRRARACPPWGPGIQNLLDEYKTCDAGNSEAEPRACHVFVARALEVVYGAKDFLRNGSATKYLTAKEIVDATVISEWWERIGIAFESSALLQAGTDATRNVAIIAVWKNPTGHRQVAIVLPGADMATNSASRAPTPQASS